MSSRRGLIIGVLVVVVLATACTVATSADLPSPLKSPPPPSLKSAPQPATCPRHWDFNPVEGSDQLMVPGQPTAAVRCGADGPHRRFVARGSQLTELVHLLNSRRHRDARFCNHNWGGVVLPKSQTYFNYSNGDVEVVLFDPNCASMTNGKLTARFGQAAT